MKNFDKAKKELNNEQENIELANIEDLNGGYKFKFSVLMAVYNVEEFIEEALESLIDQSIGFENLQLILVDDGSEDRSGEICDEYREKYPDNIVVVHKENGGLSDARNAGLKYIEGRYVSFFDPDDKLTKTTLNKVYSLFSENDDILDIVSIPLYYFGDRCGPHHLNGKFAKGTRVINLQKEPDIIQLSLASSFIKNEDAKTLHFSKELVTAEDAEQLLRRFISKPFLGVVHNCGYLYRRREGSQVTAAVQKKGYYNDYIKFFTLKCLNYAKNTLGYIPRFVQNAVMCDLQWKLGEADAPAVLNEEELAEYYALIDEVISIVDDDILRALKSIVLDTKVFLLAKKYEKLGYVNFTHDNIYYGFDNRIDHGFANNSIQLHSLTINKETVTVSARQVYLAPSGEIDAMYLAIGEERYRGENVRIAINKRCAGRPVSFYYMADFTFPLSALKKRETRLFFVTEIGGITVRNRNLKSARFFPIETRYKKSYYYKNGLLFTLTKDALFIKKTTTKECKRREKVFRRELWRSNKLGERKAVVVRALAKVYKLFHRKPIWIITDRLNKAGDNGEAFFRHLKETKFNKAQYYYAITKCPDYNRLKPLGNVVDHNSIKYKLLYLISDVIISSHGDDFVINPFHDYYYPYKDILVTKNFIFLQHGVIQTDISGWLQKYKKDIKGFVCSAKPEARSIIDYDYFYNEENVWLTGLPRFDRLYNDEQKIITLMPTWRRYLVTYYSTETGIWNLVPDFKESAYYQFYNSLLNDKRLIEACERNGYTLAFMPHPNIIPHVSEFDQDPRVKVFSINDEYRDIYAKSNLILTDYSSAVFDFAYMRKPIVYAHFDKSDFFAGEHICVEGYFDYERDGFGEVTYDYESTVALLIEYVENDCKLKDKYRERADQFFAFSDQNNCKRILDRILEMDNED